MPRNFRKLIFLFLSFCLIFEQSAFAQSIDLSHYFANLAKPVFLSDKFRPLHLRCLGYDNLSQDFKLLLDKGDTKKEDLENKNYIEESTQTLLKYFFIGLALPNEKFWVNLRPDSPDNILDPELEKTDIGRIFLEADVQLKKDTASFTSPQTPEGKEYWDKLYRKAGELFGSENITIPTLTRPWIVPNEIIIREAPDNAYIYKATLKVMLEEDYLSREAGSRNHSDTLAGKSSQPSEPNYQPLTSHYNFSDPRLKELNQYSTQLIKETIIPKLTYEVNTSKRYAPLRQVYYSLILAQWFKARFRSQRTENREQRTEKANNYLRLIDSGNLTNLTSIQPYDKQTYFKQYQKSFADGEYNLQEPVYTPLGQSIRRYMSGGIKNLMSSSAVTIKTRQNGPPKSGPYAFLIKDTVLSGEQSWSRIQEELKMVKDKYGEQKYFIGSKRIMNDEVFYGEVNKSMQLLRVGNHQGYDLAQIEDMFFIDQAVYEDLSKGLRDDLKRKTIIVPNLFQSIIGQSDDEGGRMKKFTAAAILSILHSNIAGKCVIDAGAGDGMLALAAAKLGASQVIIIDNDNKELDKARKNLENNGLKEGKNFFIITGDLRDIPKIIEQFPKIKSDIVLISNIGNWENYQDGRGRVTNLTSLELALGIAKKRKVRISEIILGGYEREMPASLKYGHKITMDNGYKKHRPDNDIEILKKKGFKVRPEKSYVEECVSISFVSSAVEDKEEDSKELHFEGKGLKDKTYPEILKQVIDLLQEETKKIERAAQESGFFEKYAVFKVREFEESELKVFLRDLEEFRNKIKISTYDLTVNFWGWPIPINYDLKNKLSKASFYLSLVIQNGITPITPRILEKKEYLKGMIDSYIKLLLDIKEPLKIVKEYAETMDETKAQPQMTYMLLLEYKKLFQKADPEVSSSIDMDNPGGIAFNALPIQIESVASSVLGAFPAADAFKGDLDAEWSQIQQIFNAGIRTSAQRLSEYTLAASASPLAEEKIDGVRAMLADILRREEEDEKLPATQPALKKLLSALESDNPASELSLSLT